MGVLLEDGPEERGTGGEDELVCLDLSCPTADGAVKEIFLLSDLSKGNTNVTFKIIPPQAKLLTGIHHCC